MRSNGQSSLRDLARFFRRLLEAMTCGDRMLLAAIVAAGLTSSSLMRLSLERGQTAAVFVAGGLTTGSAVWRSDLHAVADAAADFGVDRLDCRLRQPPCFGAALPRRDDADGRGPELVRDRRRGKSPGRSTQKKPCLAR